MEQRLKVWILGVLLMVSSFGAKSADWFASEPIQFSAYHLFDMGVAKIDTDDYLDLFTANHSDEQGVFLGGVSANFSSNRVTHLELNQDLEFPGLEGRRSSPKQEQAGLYVYWRHGHIYFVANSTMPVEGYIEFPSTLEELNTTGFVAAEVASSMENGLPTTRIDIAFESPGEIEILPRHVGVPFTVHLSQDVPLDNVYVGWRRIQPQNHIFEASLLDRHGYAWTDFNNNGETDVFITRGGLHGDIGSFPTSIINDELLLQTGGRFIHSIDSTGIGKSGGRGRQAAWVDANNDGLIDLHIGNLRSPNLLFLQQSNGEFHEVAESYGLNHSNSGAFVWLDSDGDADMDLLIKDIDTREIKHYRNQLNGIFSEEILISNSGLHSLNGRLQI